MTFYFYTPVHYDCGGSHYIVVHDFRDVLYFGESYIEIIVPDYFLDSLISRFAFGTPRTNKKRNRLQPEILQPNIILHYAKEADPKILFWVGLPFS